MQECVVDRHPTATGLRNNRIRYYRLLLVSKNCPLPTYIIANWLWIDEATAEDANMDISCQASYELFGGVTVSESTNLELQGIPS